MTSGNRLNAQRSLVDHNGLTEVRVSLDLPLKNGATRRVERTAEVWDSATGRRFAPADEGDASEVIW